MGPDRAVHARRGMEGTQPSEHETQGRASEPQDALGKRGKGGGKQDLPSRGWGYMYGPVINIQCMPIGRYENPDGD